MVLSLAPEYEGNGESLSSILILYRLGTVSSYVKPVEWTNILGHNSNSATRTESHSIRRSTIRVSDSGAWNSSWRLKKDECKRLNITAVCKPFQKIICFQFRREAANGSVELKSHFTKKNWLQAHTEKENGLAFCSTRLFIFGKTREHSASDS